MWLFPLPTHANHPEAFAILLRLQTLTKNAPLKPKAIKELPAHSPNLGTVPEQFVIAVVSLVGIAQNGILTFDAIIECNNLNPVKLPVKQINLYQNICELKDKYLTYKQISDKLNKLGIPPTRAKAGKFTPQKDWPNYTKVKKSRSKS